MYLAHFVGAHHFDNQWELVLHYIITWAPLVLSVAVGIFVAYRIIKRQLRTAKQNIKDE